MNEISPETVQSMLENRGALLSGHFRLSSGLHSNRYVQCARLLSHPRDADALGEGLAAKLASINPEMIVAPALGGLVIGQTVSRALGIPMIFTERKDGEMMLRRGFDVPTNARCLIIEDVVTTGKSTKETQRVIEGRNGRVAGFGSVLNRSGEENPFESPYHYLLALDLESWEEKDCPMCSEGVPIDSPGSRFGDSK